jgi:alanine racemase
VGVFSPRAEINLQALKHNLAHIRRTTQAQVMAVVKANAYGHGALDVCAALEADSYAVARVTEGLTLRDSFPDIKLVVLQGFYHQDELRLAAQAGLDVVVHHVNQIELLEQTPLPEPIKVWLKIDTGMHRLGFDELEVKDAHQRLIACKSVQEPIDLMSHFACADEPNHPLSKTQVQRFVAMVPANVGVRTFSNSSAFLNFPSTHIDYVRTGLILYGVSPVGEARPDDFPFQPVMTLKSNLIAVRAHKKGESVGYGATWVAPEDTLLGVVGIGYADGYPRSVPTGTPVLVGDRQVPLVGRVSMDMITVDLGLNALEVVGDEVILWGEALPIETIAAAAKTLPYELMTQLTSRVTRHVKD